MKKLLILSVIPLFLFFTFNCCAQFSVSTVISDVHCYGQSNGSITANPTGGTVPYTYLWGPGRQTTQTISGLTASTYSVKVTDHSGLTVSTTASVTQPSVLIASVTAKNSAVCPGQSDSLFCNGSGGTVPYQYLWNAPLDDISCPTCQNTNSYPYGADYVVTAINDMNGCTASASVSVTVRPFPYATISGPMNPIAPGRSDTLVALATGATSYLWSNSSTSSSIIVSPAVSTTYSVKATNTYGCYDTAHYTIDTNSVGNGSSSGNAIRVIPSISVVTSSYSTMDSVVWFSFTAADSNTQIIATGAYLGMPVPHVHRLTLYNNSLQMLVDEPMPDITGANQIRIDISHLTIGNTYYVRAARCPAHANMAGCNPSTSGECNPTQRWDFQMCFRTVPVFVPDDSDGEAPAVSQLYYEHRGQITDLNGIPRFDVKAYTNNAKPEVVCTDSAVSFVYQHTDTAKSFIDTFQRVDMICTGPSAQPSTPVFKMQEDGNAGYLNYFLGHVPNGVTGVEGYSRLVYKNVYPNVDMHVYSNSVGTKLYFVCNPPTGGGSAGNPADIELQFKGATSVTVNGSNGLDVVTELGTLSFAPGFAYTDSAGVVKAKSWQAYFVAVNSNTVKFNTGTYNTSEPLIIEVDRGHLSSLSGSCIENLCWSTYMGGSRGSDEVSGIYTDAQGNIYTAGSTTSQSFPVTNGVIQDSLNAGAFPWDATIVKYDVNTKLLWSTYYGGTDLDAANSVVTDATGNVFVTGLTYSFNFPIQQPNVVQYPHAYYQAYLNGDTLLDCLDGDAFVLELNQSGTQKKWATFWGGCDDGVIGVPTTETYSEEGNKLVIDGNKNLYVVGGHSIEIQKPTDPLVTKVGAYNDTVGTGFILKFNVDSSSSNFGNLEWATNIGGNNGGSTTAATLNGCALDNNNNLFVTGTTDYGSYPVGYTRSILPYEGNGDAVVTKFDAVTDSIDWSTCYGGDNSDYGQAIAVSQTGNVYITGYTAPPFSVKIPLKDPNPGNDFYEGTDNASFNNQYTGFVAELNNNSGGIYWSTYFGGIDEMQLFGIALDADSDIYITGATGNAFPLPGAPVANTYTLSFTSYPNNPCLAEFNSSLQYGWGTCIDGVGGNDYGIDVSYAAAVDKTNKRFFMGGKVVNTGGTPYPIVQYGSGYIQTTNNEPKGDVTSFISMFDLSPIVTNVDNLNVKSDGGFNVYPNPSTGNITAEIDLSQNERVEFILYNMMGEVVYEKNIAGQTGLINQEIDLSLLPNGIYLLKVNESGQYFTQKIVKQN